MVWRYTVHTFMHSQAATCMLGSIVTVWVMLGHDHVRVYIAHVSRL